MPKKLSKHSPHFKKNNNVLSFTSGFLMAFRARRDLFSLQAYKIKLFFESHLNI
jgi:hypothetical protein